jgi:hypothetical protein
MQQRRLDRGPAGLGGVEAAGADVRPGVRLGDGRKWPKGFVSGFFRELYDFRLPDPSEGPEGGT